MDYVGGWYIFSDTYGVAAVSSTKTGGMWFFSDFYSDFRRKILGYSFQKWLENRVAEEDADPTSWYDKKWYYGMTILGDPTLSLTTTIVVPDDYPTIQEAINNASGGDTIFVRNGTYYEHIVINKSLILEGENKYTTIIDGGNGMSVLSNNVRISNFTIQNASQDWGSVYVDGYVNMTFSNNIMLNNHQGIRLIHTSGNVISDNVINGNSFGAIGFDWANDNIVHNNTLTNSGTLGAIHGGYPSYNNIFSENTIIGNTHGIEMNNIFNDNRFFHNTFIDNTVQVYFYGPMKSNSWDDEYPSGGNYWSNYGGVDLFSGPYQNETGSDGIGDTPYIIDENNTDNYPLISPWIPPDIAVMNITLSKTIIGQGFALRINVTVINQGNKIEAFNLTAYANITIIHRGSIILTNGTSTIITFTWNTTGFDKGYYTISAYITPIPSETDTEDNTFTNGEIKVGIPGDVNGDGIVNYEDIYTELVLRFMCYSTDPCYSANSDIDCNGRINYQDIYIAIIHFMETEP